MYPKGMSYSDYKDNAETEKVRIKKLQYKEATGALQIFWYINGCINKNKCIILGTKH